MILIYLAALLMPMILITINLIIFKKKLTSRETSSAFECGFDLKILPRNSFSLKFYLISLIFLIFDIEIAIILPLPIILNSFLLSYSMHFVMLFFLVILILGLLYEWYEGALNWLL